MKVTMTFKMKALEKTRLREISKAVGENMSKFIVESLETRYKALPEAVKNPQRFKGAKCVDCNTKGK